MKQVTDNPGKSKKCFPGLAALLAKRKVKKVKGYAAHRMKLP